jgi:multidrug efflux pump subunit AcrB
MNFLARMLTNHPLVNILFTVVLVMGGMAYQSMPREQDPEINFNWVSVRTVLPGASAEDVEKLVTGPLEDAIRNVQDIKFMSSNSRESVSLLLVRFRDISVRVFDKRVNDLRREIQNKANEELPSEADDPRVIEITSSNGFPTALLVVTGAADDEHLRRHARNIKEDIERIAGVDKVLTFGLHDPEMQVQFDAQALAARGLGALDVADQLGRAFHDISAGKSRIANREWLVRVEGTTTDPEQLAQFQVASPGDRTQKVPLDHVAMINRGRSDPEQLVSVNDRPAVSMSVTKISYTNTIDLVERINDYIERKNGDLAGTGIEILLADDQTVQTRQALRVMQINAALGLILVLCVCWLFLGLRIAFMVTLGIAFSVAGAFWVLKITGNTLNISVLLGVVIVLGMLVDDAVVVVEAIYYRMQRGTDALVAAVSSLKEVGAPVASAVATTIAAFLPLMLLPGIVGKFMFVIPFVVTVGLAVSLVEAFWILPAHVIAMRGAGVAQRPKNHWRTRWTHWVRVKYTLALVAVMRHPKRFLSAAVLAFVMAVTGLSMGLIRMEFFTFDPFRIYYVNVDMPAGSPLDETLRQTQVVEDIVRQFVEPHEIRTITSMAGIKFTDVEPLFGDQYGQIQVALQPDDNSSNSRSVTEIVESMRKAVESAPGDGVKSFMILSGGPPTTSPISVKVRSDDFATLRAAADAVKEIVRNIPGTRDVVDNDVPGGNELILQIDQAAVRRAGLDPASVARLVRLHGDGEIVAFMRDRGEKVELRVRGDIQSHQDIMNVLADPVVLPNGETTTFRSLVSFKTQPGRSTIRHHNLRRAITVEAELDPEISNTVAANQLLLEGWEAIRQNYPDADLDFSGELDDIQESLDSMLGLFLLGIGLIYLLLATQFRSYFQPMLILATVPMAFTGVVFGLLLTGNPLSLYTLYGIIALTGIAVNSAIVLIDAANTRINAGMRPLHATVYAARRRIVPVIMTTTTTIAGLFSLAVGLGGKSLVWGPVASSIVAGLGVATILTMFVIPVLYRLFMRGHGGDRVQVSDSKSATL